MPRESRGRGLPRNSNSSQLTTSSRFGTSRSSRSSKRSTKSRLEGPAELDILEIVDDINVLRFRGVQCRALHADTRARWGAAAPHRASDKYMYIDKPARIRASCSGAISHISKQSSHETRSVTAYKPCSFRSARHNPPHPWSEPDITR